MPAPREGGECSRAQDEVYACYGYLVAEPGTVICLLGGSHRRLKAPQQGLSVVREPPKFPESSQTSLTFGVLQVYHQVRLCGLRGAAVAAAVAVGVTMHGTCMSLCE